MIKLQRIQMWPMWGHWTWSILFRSDCVTKPDRKLNWVGSFPESVWERGHLTQCGPESGGLLHRPLPKQSVGVGVGQGNEGSLFCSVLSLLLCALEICLRDESGPILTAG